MNILEILRKELEGKKIILEKYMFRMGKKSDPIPRFFIPGMSASERAKNDTRFSFRAIERDGITEVDYDQRMKDQIPDEIKKSKSSYILDNDFSDNIQEKIHSLHQFLKQSK